MNYYNDDGFILCQICEQPFKFITEKHLRKRHNISTKEYREMYPDVPMTGKCYRKEKETKKIIEQEILFEPVVEELDFNEILDDNSFKENESIIKLAECKIPVPIKSSDPMDDKFRIIAYLKLSFPKIKDNYMFKKKNPDGNIEYQFITDMADPSCKIVFDFPNAFWHNEQICVSRIVRNRMLKSFGWTIIEIDAPMPKVLHVENVIKNY